MSMFDLWWEREFDSIWGDDCYFPDEVEDDETREKIMSKEELHLWHDFLKNYTADYSLDCSAKFVRRKGSDIFVTDFYCEKANVFIELYSPKGCEENLVINKIRTIKIEEPKCLLIKVPNDEVNKNFKGVCRYIDIVVKQALRQIY